MIKLKMYIAHPMTGLDGGEVIDYYKIVQDIFEHMGIEVLHPLVAKGGLRDVGVINSHGYEDITLARDHSIKERDQWMVKQADLVLVDFSASKSISIGCCSELAWADLLGKHTVVVLPNGDVHTHAFVLQEADVIFETFDSAVDYIETLVNCKI